MVEKTIHLMMSVSRGKRLGPRTRMIRRSVMSPVPPLHLFIMKVKKKYFIKSNDFHLSYSKMILCFEALCNNDGNQTCPLVSLIKPAHVVSVCLTGIDIRSGSLLPGVIVYL